MKASRIVAVLLVLCLTLPLGGCFAQDALQDAAETASKAADAVDTLADTAENAANAAGDFAQSATEAADALSSIEWGADNRLVLKDATSGEVLAESGDQAVIQSALSALSQENSIAPAPDSQPEYACEVWQPATETALGSSDAADEQLVLEVTTFVGSDVVEMHVPLIGASLYLSSPGTADALRNLVG